MEGIVAGVRARGGKLDTWDLVAMNAWLEMSYYVGWHNQRNKIPNPPGVTAPEHCSAFVATGSYPRDGKVVIGHNAWTGYVDGQRWNIIFDIVPANGHRILMDGFPGLIHSADDFGINLSRRIRKGVEFNLALDNLADRFYYETQNYFESRLPGQGPLYRIHATPGYPLTVMVGLTFRLFGK